MSSTSSKIGSKIAWLVLLIIIVGGGYYYRQDLPILSRFFQVTPCVKPLTYKVGSFDNRFNISQDKFKQAIAEAAQIWDKAANRQLFQYQDNGTMPINLIYDSRQQATDQLRKLNLNVDTSRASYDQLKNAYLKLKSQTDAQKLQYNLDKQQFDAQKQAYDAAVQSSNKRGGANPTEYQKLEAERIQLNTLADQLNQEVTALNQQVDNVNALVATLNRIGSELNLDVGAYNTAGQSLGEFEEGVYATDNSGQKIEIYQFDNYMVLVRVLAHELGHALGLEHVADPEAIMYKLNQSKNAKPTAADLAELKRICKM